MPDRTRQRRLPPPRLGPMLGAARLRAGLRLREAARLAGISHSHLIRLETGKRVPSVTVAAAIADALRLDDAERTELFAAAVPDAGRDWPGRRGESTAEWSGALGHHPEVTERH